MNAELRYFQRLLAKSNLRLKGRALDVGCGNGHFAAELSRIARETVAVDIEPHPDWEKYSSPNLRFECGDAENLIFPDDSFDSVVSVNMLHHTQRPDRAIREMLRVCKDDGYIAIFEPNRWNPLGYVHLTLLGKHEHFSTKKLLSIVGPLLGPFELRQFECHCYPLPRWSRDLLERIEDRLDRWRFWKPFIFYNVIVRERQTSLGSSTA